MSDRLHILLTTYNLGLRGAELTIQELKVWLTPSLDSFHASGDLPDLVVISLQEIADLHLALAGLNGPLLQSLSLKIASVLGAHADALLAPAAKTEGELEKAPPTESFRLVTTASLANVGLLVFARVRTLGRRELAGDKGRIIGSRTAQVALGAPNGWLSNKGAAAARVWVERAPADDEKATPTPTMESLTFVGCHLTAHADNLPARIADYARLTSNLLLPSSPYDAPGSPKTQINDSTHAFLLGDLNFRLAPPAELAKPGALAPELKSCAAQGDWTSLTAFDQLLEVRSKGQAVGGWEEAPLGGFAPTYKLRPNGGGEGDYTWKRTPSWTDRVLYSSATDPTASRSEAARLQLHSYKPPFSRTQCSDHLPVSLLLSLPVPTSSTTSTTAAKPLRPIQVGPPAAEALIEREAWLNWTLDRAVGWGWAFLLSAGFGYGEWAGAGALVALLGVMWVLAGL